MPRLLASLALVLLATPALAQEKPPEPPKPDPAFTAAMKPFLGTWKCSGKYMADGQEHKGTSTLKFDWDLGGFWMVEKFEGMHVHAVTWFGWDAAAKEFVSLNADSMGDYTHETSKGPDASGKWVWSGKGVDEGRTTDVKDLLTWNPDRSFTVAGSDVSGSYEATCKR
jgi:hypothetical protein